jgi:hypothetical protein
VCVAACDGPGRVQYEGGRCFKDGRPLTAQEVQADQAEVAARIASRQPWFAVITIGIVVLAAAGNAEKALLLIRSRHVEGRGPFFLERLRDLLLRQREKPALFGTIVGGSLVLIVVAAIAYIYLDIDKRANERALGMLQFCHLALRTQQEEGDLEEQRRNLQAIQSTAGDIRTLVGQLPPEQQRKAQLIVDEMNVALDKQGKVVGQYIARTDEAQRDLSSHTLAMERGLASVQGELSELRSLPANLKDLEGAAHHIDETTTSFDTRLADVRARLATLDTKLDTLMARPICSAPSAGGSASARGAPGAGPSGSASAGAKLDGAGAGSVAKSASSAAPVQPASQQVSASSDAGKRAL